MNRWFVLAVACVASSAALAQQQQQQQPQEPMRFFVTSAAPGGGNLGGLEGADAICQELAAAAGAGERTWHAYLSTQGDGAVNARDRIGSGPWHNAEGVLIAASVADLHGDVQRDRNNLYKDTAIDEMGNLVNGRGDEPNTHDIFTGSDSLGNAIAGSDDATCGNWTSDAAEGNRAMVGHHDRSGGGNTSWNSVHMTRACDAENVARTGGAGRFYCFAID